METRYHFLQNRETARCLLNYLLERQRWPSIELTRQVNVLGSCLISSSHAFRRSEVCYFFSLTCIIIIEQTSYHAKNIFKRVGTISKFGRHGHEHPTLHQYFAFLGQIAVSLLGTTLRLLIQMRDGQEDVFEC